MVKVTKLLGVMIDDQLSFSHHISYIKSKAARGFGILYKAKKSLNKSTLYTLYYSFIHLYFSYCISVWGNTFRCYLHSLNVLQNRTVRIISGLKWDASASPLYHFLKIKTIQELYIYSVQLFVFKFHNNMLPDIFNSFFIYNQDILCHNSR